jgi:hypothetical protein
MKLSPFALFVLMSFVSASASAVTQGSTKETFTTSRTWTVPAGTPESERLARLLEATQPAGLQGVEQHFSGSVMTITYVRSGLATDSLGTPGGGGLPPTGHQGDTYSVTSCNLAAKTVTTVDYEWDDSANGGAGGWVVTSSKTVYEMSMTSCPGR